MIAAMFVFSGFAASNSADASVVSSIRGKIANTAIGKPGTEAYCFRPDFNKSCVSVTAATTFAKECVKFKTKPAVRDIIKSCRGAGIVTEALKGKFGDDARTYMEHLVSSKNIKAFLAEKEAKKAEKQAAAEHQEGTESEEENQESAESE